MNTQYSAQVASTRPTAVVIDDSSLTRAAFGQVYSALDVVATFSSVDAFLAAAFTVDVVILDLMLNPDLDTPMLQGPKAIQELTRRGHRVCIYSDERRMLILARCFSAGALGLARKSDPLEDNQAAFLRVASGYLVVPSSMVGLAKLLARRCYLPELTERQIEVLNARARGEGWKLLARRLNISEKTAQGHLEAVMVKMVLHLQHAGLDPYASPADVERALGLAPGDLDDHR